MGTKDKTQTKNQERMAQDRGTPQVGTHGNAKAAQDRTWDDPATRAEQQGDRTDKAMPSGTTPLERDQRPINQQR
jgi:hypothetical protein